jgi:hypothetical protein
MQRPVRVSLSLGALKLGSRTHTTQQSQLSCTAACIPCSPHVGTRPRSVTHQAAAGPHCCMQHVANWMHDSVQEQKRLQLCCMPPSRPLRWPCCTATHRARARGGKPAAAAAASKAHSSLSISTLHAHSSNQSSPLLAACCRLGAGTAAQSNTIVGASSRCVQRSPLGAQSPPVPRKTWRFGPRTHAPSLAAITLMVSGSVAASLATLLAVMVSVNTLSRSFCAVLANGRVAASGWRATLYEKHIWCAVQQCACMRCEDVHACHACRGHFGEGALS